MLARRGRGILAADESVGTIGKRLTALGLENTIENRRQFREILITAPNNQDSFSGVILFHETVYQSTTSGTPFLKTLAEKGILAGVKVDTGLKMMADSPRETYTSGLDGLGGRCERYYADGARFAKWRAALRIDVKHGLPTEAAVLENARTLAKYARIAQQAGLVAIVEPEILIDGGYSQMEAGMVARRVISTCYEMLEKEGVLLEGTLLKTMMVMPGVECAERGSVSAREVAERTLEVLLEVVPGMVGGVVFLSGGMGEVEATENLHAINVVAKERGDVPWTLSFSFGRALQRSALEVWAGREDMVDEARRVAAEIGKVNARAQLGLFDGKHPCRGARESLYEGFRGWRSGEDPKGV